jgi:hypothetical protein
MTDVFLSYARSTQAAARKMAEALRGLGYDVWLDDQLPAHRAYADVIEEQLRAAKSVVVVWSADAAKSEWVRSEAELARVSRKLVQLTVDRARLPMPFDQIQCVDLLDWNGEPDAPAWRQVTASIAELTRGGEPLRRTGADHSAAPSPTASEPGPTPEDDPHAIATRRADAEIAFRKHVVRYVAVNAGLAVINLVTSPRELWFQWPLFAWGIGLAAHGLVVFQQRHDGRDELIARKLREMRRTDRGPP